MIADYRYGDKIISYPERKPMDGIIFLRGAFYDPSIKMVSIYNKTKTGVGITRVKSMDEVDEYLKSHHVNKITVSEIKFEEKTGNVIMQCVVS
jgi:hypothetical protein